MSVEAEVWLVRHGQTAANAERRIVGVMDVPLDDVGHGQAARLAACGVMPVVSEVWCSPLLRARQTAQALAQQLRIVDDLREMHQGELEGMLATEAIERYPAVFASFFEDPTASLPGGERLDAVAARVRAAIEGVAQPGEVRVVVAHQLCLAAACCALLGEPLTGWRRYGLGNAEARRLLRRNDGSWDVGPVVRASP